jgi:hypothetical protein
MSEVKKLEIIGTIKDGIAIGTKNIGPILVNLLLWVLTCWIPYLNVGTTIGLTIGLVKKASLGETIPFTEIFNSKYRQYMGEFFLVSGLMGVGIAIGTVFLVIPGIVTGLAWSFAPLITIDKGKNPSEAIYLSSKATYGNKWRMFAVMALVGLLFCILCGIFVLIPGVRFLLITLLMIFSSFVMIGLQASMYKQLTSDI